MSKIPIQYTHCNKFVVFAPFVFRSVPAICVDVSSWPGFAPVRFEPIAKPSGFNCAAYGSVKYIVWFSKIAVVYCGFMYFHAGGTLFQSMSRLAWFLVMFCTKTLCQYCHIIHNSFLYLTSSICLCHPPSVHTLNNHKNITYLFFGNGDWFVSSNVVFVEITEYKQLGEG